MSPDTALSVSRLAAAHPPPGVHPPGRRTERRETAAWQGRPRCASRGSARRGCSTPPQRPKPGARGGGSAHRRDPVDAADGLFGTALPHSSPGPARRGAARAERHRRSASVRRCQPVPPRRPPPAEQIPISRTTRAGHSHTAAAACHAGRDQQDRDELRLATRRLRGRRRRAGCSSCPPPGPPTAWTRNGDGRRDPADPDDAITAAAHYLRASGAPGDWYRAIFAYNHADWYVRDVLALADRYQGACAADPPPTGASETARSLRWPVVGKVTRRSARAEGHACTRASTSSHRPAHRFKRRGGGQW